MKSVRARAQRGPRRHALLMVAITALSAGCRVSTPVSASHRLLGTTVPVPGEPRWENSTGVGAHRSQCAQASHFLLFWSPSCERCKPWLAELDRLWRQSARPHLQPLGIASHADRDDAARVLSAYSIGLPQLVDREGTWMETYGITNLPTILVVDRCGKLVFVSSSRMPRDDIGRLYHGLE